MQLDNLLKNIPCKTTYANSLDAFVPEFWANESLAILEEQMVVSRLVHRDFENMVAKYGDVVNTRKPGEFEAKRKAVTDEVTVQDAVATNVAVPLDQLIHVSFIIYDGEESKSFKELSDIFIRPAMLAQARIIDQILLGQYAQFPTFAGALSGLTSSNSKNYLLDLRKEMNVNKVYPEGRNLILNPSTETELLKTDIFVQANTVGDDGSAMRRASLGQKFGFDTYMCQNMAVINTGNTLKSGAINNANGYPKGTTALTVDGFTGEVAANNWVTIAGDDTPHRIASHSATMGNTTTITLKAPGLRRAVVNDAVVNTYVAGAVNLTAGYAAGWSKPIVVDGFTVSPQTGQMVSFGTTSTNAVYTIVGTPSTTSITLDRPLEAAIADDAAVNIGPAGGYNFAFHRNALALVCRPLAMPKTGAGALSFVTNRNQLSMRATITYLGKSQGHLVTLDLLCGVKVLDSALGAVLLG